jgi:hypothetical protein
VSTAEQDENITSSNLIQPFTEERIHPDPLVRTQSSKEESEMVTPASFSTLIKLEEREEKWRREMESKEEEENPSNLTNDPSPEISSISTSIKLTEESEEEKKGEDPNEMLEINPLE